MKSISPNTSSLHLSNHKFITIEEALLKKYMMKSSEQEATTVNITDTAKTPAAASPHPPPSTAKSTTTTTNKQTNHQSKKKSRGGWKQRCGSIFDFILRIAGIVSALVATITMGTADQTLPFFSQLFQFHASYDDLPAFLFFVIVNAIASGYLVLSLPFSILTIIRPQLGGVKMLLLILDTVMVALTTAAAASAAAIVYLAHNGNSKANWVSICQQFNEFCQQVSGAVIASFVAAVIFMLLVVLSALRITKQKH